VLHVGNKSGRWVHNRGGPDNNKQVALVLAGVR
jgi:hypothetical protein